MDYERNCLLQNALTKYKICDVQWSLSILKSKFSDEAFCISQKMSTLDEAWIFKIGEIKSQEVGTNTHGASKCSSVVVCTASTGRFVPHTILTWVVTHKSGVPLIQDSQEPLTRSHQGRDPYWRLTTAKRPISTPFQIFHMPWLPHLSLATAHSRLLSKSTGPTRTTPQQHRPRIPARSPSCWIGTLDTGV